MGDAVSNPRAREPAIARPPAIMAIRALSRRVTYVVRFLRYSLRALRCSRDSERCEVAAVSESTRFNPRLSPCSTAAAISAGVLGRWLTDIP